ncbi:hypothetical protein DMB66_01295 [Actinoplanes sp. ATCC 53533]|uniref:SMP-30/gluconolactonase/LRE family protein n=1 Tax=Actinoplanes sp. ATCC 53533 TaxID=1288362 RepID=UPI000F776BEB|nr:SMP-30/gluconolactonase/LRE family protein [Actinoplanes sp. ATCC 53533]RSM74101.1 hypothetical protein DMB66_01295 [Actinoplanes sp. ATCC 53533]
MTAPSRFDATGRRHVISPRWTVDRLVPPNRLWGANGIAFGPDGRLYVAQFLAGQISAVDPGSGDIETVVPIGGPVQSPDDLAFGADGSMYIADLVPGRVWRRGPDGGYTVVADQLRNPNGITCVGDRLFVNEMALDGRLLELFPGGGDPVVLTGGLALGNAMQRGPDGHLYYPHMLTGQVFRISPDGGTPELVADAVHEPVAVRFDRGGVLQVLSRGAAGIVTRIELFGSGTRRLVTSGVAGLDNAAFDDDNRMFVSSFASGGVTELHPDGRTREVVPRGLDGPFGVTVDLGGTVHAADHYRVTTPADGGEELLTFVHGIVAADGVLHVTSQYGDVRTYDPVSRTVRVRARGLNRPAGIAVRADGALLVAEAGAGRLLAIAVDDTVTVLADDLGEPMDVAVGADQRCYVSDARAGAVVRVDDRTPVAEGIGTPQGLTVRGDELFVVDSLHRRLVAVHLVTGETRIDAEDLPVGAPPGVSRPDPGLFCHGLPGVPRMFAGLALDPDGSLWLSADGEGSVLHLTETGR